MNALLKSVYKRKKGVAEKLVEEVKKETRPKKQAKSRAKKGVKVTIRKKVFGKAPEEHTFYLKSGKQARTIMELVDRLEHVTEEEFQHHVNEMNNDFANWIEHVFDDKKLAKELRTSTNRLEHQVKIMNHMLKELGVK